MSEQSQTAYVVTEGSYSDYHIVRIYLDREEAQRFVDAYNDTLSRRYQFTCNEYSLEEFTIGGDRAEMDGPIWEGIWQRRRVEKIDSYRVAAPGGLYYFREYFAPREYHPNEWHDSFDVHEVWHTGPTPPKAEVAHISDNSFYATVRGTSKEHVEKSLYDTAARVKAERAGIS